GEEISIIALVSGTDYKLFTPSQDHKARFEGDTGPNTGGMGAYAPAPLATPNLINEIERIVILPTLDGLKKDGESYLGFLYFGLMMTVDGPKILEYNCRLGDPETQVILPQLESDLLDAIEFALSGNLANCDWKLADDYAVGIVAASDGYPESYEKGKEISGLDSVKNATVFQAGTKMENGKLQTSGGRVLLVTAQDKSLKNAQKTAYRELEKISFDGMIFRKDIAEKGIRRLENE
ncbi:MAG: phosphoribosylamine--glycine ligase, partial [Candidatus Marinimicrobia bacterium]|nr:phosphoribosylamine--glycine ligase [Candidatus Neomarinimicrobiota bacterium]